MRTTPKIKAIQEWCIANGVDLLIIAMVLTMIVCLLAAKWTRVI